MDAGRKLIAAVAVVLGTVLGAPAGAAAINLTHTFNSSAQSWQFGHALAEDGATFDGVAGNPPGSVKGADMTADLAGGTQARFVAPSAFDGNYTPNIGGTISFDLNTVSEISNGRTIQLFVVSGFGALVRQVVPVDTMGLWRRYSAVLAPGDWEVCVIEDPPCPLATPDLFASGLADVDRVFVAVDIVDGTGETYFLDNFSVTEPPPPTGAPPAIAPPLGTAPPDTVTKKCPKGKKLVRKRGKAKCKKRRKK